MSIRRRFGALGLGMGLGGGGGTILRFIIDLFTSTNTSTTGGTVFGYPVDGVIADGQTLLTIPAGYPRMKGARWLAPGWSAVDAAGASLTNAMDVADAGTNLVFPSEDFNDVRWTKVAVTVDSAVESYGDLVLDRLNVNAGLAQHEVFSTVVSTGLGAESTASAFVKDDGQRYVFLALFRVSNEMFGAVFDLNDGSVTDTVVGSANDHITGSSAELVSTGLWRLSLTGDINSAADKLAIINAAGSATPSYNGNQPEYNATDGEDLLVGGSQVELGKLSPYRKTTTATVSTDADVNTVATPSNVEQDADWAFKFRGTPAQTGEALKALFSFDSDATNYTEIQLNAANITANSVLLGVSNGAAVGLYTHTADVQFETNVYYVAATKTLGIRSDDVSGDISAVAFVEDTLTSHPVITALLSCGHRNEANIYQGTILNSGMPQTFQNKEAAGW